MKTYSLYYSLVWLVCLTGLLSSCRTEDPGPYRPDDQSYNLENFDQIKMGNAFPVYVKQGSQFSVVASGDRRNLADLDVWVSQGTLQAQYHNNNYRKHETTFEITMPVLRGIDLSGAVQSTVSGFGDDGTFEIELSGASELDATVQAERIRADLSGASRLYINGKANDLRAGLSGASTLKAFGLESKDADIEASGASTAEVKVATQLKVNASGASKVRYIGQPTLDVQLSGGSTVQRD